MHNADEYCELVEDFSLRSGIRRQMEAFKGEKAQLGLAIYGKHTRPCLDRENG